MTSNFLTTAGSRAFPANCTAYTGRRMLGLPDGVTACLFDMDGVITQTAKVHDAAWKEMFDEFLRDWSASHNQPFVPFDPVRDYDEYVDGKPRLEGTASFLESRGIELPTGSQDDPPGTPTLWGLSNKKNDLVQHVLERDGVQPYEGSRALRRGGPRRRACSTAIVSSSANTEAVLKAAGVAEPVRGARRPPGGRGAPAARQARARHVPRGGADARRRRRRTRSSSRTRSPGSRRDERVISDSSSAWTGSARPTSSASTAPTSVVKDLVGAAVRAGGSGSDDQQRPVRCRALVPHGESSRPAT